jgi:protein-S-isoprenylcysteine O-methyltransferase Ste14
MSWRPGFRLSVTGVYYIPMAIQHDILETVSLSPILVLVFFGLGIVGYELFPVFLGPARLMDIIGIVLMALGTALLVSSESYRHEFFSPSTNIVCFDFYRGPYRLSRHPSYISFLFLFIGFASILNSLIAFLLVIPLFLSFTYFIIPREEKLLRTHCSPSYDDYCKRVRMWI